MKRLLISVLIVIVMIFALASCTTTRKSGCPMAEGIIH